MERDDVGETKEVLERRGIGALEVDALVAADMAHLGWSGSPTHVRNVEGQLVRVHANEVAYLTVRAPSGRPVAVGGIDFTLSSSAGTIWQLCTHPELRSLGLGSALITALEAEIADRGRPWARLSVERGNDAAQRLYERLGYDTVGTSTSSWVAEREDGTTYTHTASLIDMAKDLAAAAPNPR